MNTTAALSEDFRDAMASVCSSVAVVTAFDGERPHGTTVSAFTSLSMDPPMVLVSLDLRSGLLNVVRRTRRFGPNVLGSGHAAAAQAFARKGTAKFDGVAWYERAGVPRLAGVPGWLACEAADFVPGGDHIIGLGRADAAESEPGTLLTYHLRAFGTHAAISG